MLLHSKKDNTKHVTLCKCVRISYTGCLQAIYQHRFKNNVTVISNVIMSDLEWQHPHATTTICEWQQLHVISTLRKWQLHAILTVETQGGAGVVLYDADEAVSTLGCFRDDLSNMAATFRADDTRVLDSAVVAVPNLTDLHRGPSVLNSAMKHAWFSSQCPRA